MHLAFYAIAALAVAGIAALMLRPLAAGSRPLYLSLVVAVPVFALGLYQLVGTPAGLDPGSRQAAPGTGPAMSLDQAIAELREKLAQDPEQPEGWALLGRALSAQQDYPAARDALARALTFAPDDPALLVDAAQARAQADPQMRFDDEAVAMLQRAIAVRSDNQRARLYLGVAHRQRGEHAEAAQAWETLLPDVEASVAATLLPQINEARTAAGLPALEADAPVHTPEALLAIEVSLDPGFAARAGLQPDAAVFVIARHPDGPPMPVAVERRSLGELPLRIALSDDNSLMPTQKLSELAEVEVFARISSSGTANRQEGDIESNIVRIALPTDEVVELVIGTQ